MGQRGKGVRAKVSEIKEEKEESGRGQNDGLKREGRNEFKEDLGVRIGGRARKGKETGKGGESRMKEGERNKSFP